MGQQTWNWLKANGVQYESHLAAKVLFAYGATVDDTVKPLAQPVWRIPLGLCEKVDKKLDKLLQADIIEEVPEGPTGWILLW